MKILIDQLYVEWDDLQTLEELEIMKKYAEKGKRYALGYSCKNVSCDVTAFSYAFRLLLNEITT